jgi:copper chaperone CopZ
MNRRLLLVPLALLLLSVAAAFAFGAWRAGEAALVELTVRKLTCGACAQKIDAALSGTPGVGRVEVDVAAGRARVEYDPQRIDPAGVAGLVTRAGYPAALRRVLTPDEYRALREGGAVAPAGGSGGCGGNCCGPRT